MSNGSVAWSTTRVRQLRVLAVVGELASASAGKDVEFGNFASRLEGETDLDDIEASDQLKALQEEGLVVLDLRLGGVVAGVRILPAGRAVLEEFLLVRDSVPARRRQLRDDYLVWLYEQIEVHDLSPTPDDYLKTAPSFMGIAYSSKDLEKTGEWLATNGFIQGQAAWQYSGPLRPTLRAKGTYTVEQGRSANDPPPAAGNTFNTTIHGPANVALGSSDVQQYLTVDWKADGLRLVDEIEAALPSLSQDLSAEIKEQVQAARSELSGTGNLSKVRSIFWALSGFLAQTGAGALGGVLTIQIAKYLASLP
jgi:hypothetical protein